VIAPRAGYDVTGAPHNKRMHPTADTRHVMLGHGAARRVMRGVRRFHHIRSKEGSVWVVI